MVCTQMRKAAAKVMHLLNLAKTLEVVLCKMHKAKTFKK